MKNKKQDPYEIQLADLANEIGGNMAVEYYNVSFTLSKEQLQDMKEKGLRTDVMSCIMAALIMNGKNETEIKDFLEEANNAGAAPSVSFEAPDDGALNITSPEVIHIDMDQFFAAVEQRDNPELKGKPIAVGHDAERGVVATASYEARRFGVHSAQSIQVAKRLCPQLIIVEPHFQRYKEVSAQLHDIFHDYTDLIESISLDEAFLDVTENKKGIELGVDIAREIKQRIRETTGLTASAGVSYCKFLAKIASDWRKPDGLTVIHPDRALDFIAQLKVEKIWGVGQKTAEKMHRMGIFTGLDLRNMSLSRLTQEFGKMGQVFYDFSRGIDNRPVISEWERKSVSCEQTFESDISENSAVTIHLYHTVLELVRRIEKNDFDFQQITRSITVDHILRTKDDILPLAKQLMQGVEFHSHPIRLLGLGVSNQKNVTAQEQQPWVELELEFEPWPEV